MRYLNPFTLLGIDPVKGSPDGEALRRGKKTALAEIELDGELRGVRLTKSEFYEVITELENPLRWRVHARVLSDPPLLAFLGEGNESGLTIRSALSLPDFSSEERRVLSPFIADRLRRSFQAHLPVGRFGPASRLVRLLDFLSPEDFESAIRPVTGFLRLKIEFIATKSDEIKRRKSLGPILPPGLEKAIPKKYYNPFSLENRYRNPKLIALSLLNEREISFLKALAKKIPTPIGELSIALNGLAVLISNELAEYEISISLSLRVGELECGSSLRQRLRDNEDAYRRYLFGDRFPICDELLKALLRDINAKTFDSGDSALSVVRRVIDVEFLNRVASSQNDASILYLTNSVIGIARKVYEKYRSKEVAFEIIKHCGQLRLSNSEGTNLLLVKVGEAHREIDRWELPALIANPVEIAIISSPGKIGELVEEEKEPASFWREVIPENSWATFSLVVLGVVCGIGLFFFLLKLGEGFNK